MKILYIHDSGRLGGAGNILIHLLNGLDKEKYQPRVVCGSDGPLVERLQHFGIPVVVVDLFRLQTIGNRAGFWIPRLGPLWQNIGYMWLSVKRLQAYLRTTSYDLIHSNGLVANLVTSLATVNDSRPLIWYEHGIQPPGFRRVIYSIFANLSPRRMIAVSNAVRNAYLPYLWNKDKIITVYNGLESIIIDSKLTEESQDIRKALGMSKSAQLVVMASLFMPWKGHEILIHAAKQLESSFSNVYFLILGDASSPVQHAYKERLLALIESLGLSEQVCFLGFRRDVFSIFRQANIVVSASLQPDPFPTVILEAMHAGKPVVATAIGGQVEMVQDGETGKLVPPGNPTELANALNWLLSHPERACAMGLAGQRRVNDHFSYKNFVKGVQSVYDKFLQ